MPWFPARVVLSKAAILRLTGEWKTALALLEKTEAVLGATGDNCLEAKTRAERAKLLLNRGEYQEAGQLLDGLITNTEADTAFHHELLLSRGTVSHRQCKYQEALDYFSRAAALCPLLNAGAANTDAAIGIVYYTLGQYDQALSHYLSAFTSAEQSNDLSLLGRMANNIGIIYQQRGDYESALSLFNRTLEAMTKMGNLQGISQVYINIGGIYYNKNENDASFEYYQKALDIALRIGDMPQEAKLYGNMGVVCIDIKDYAAAGAYLNRYLHLSEKLGDKRGQAIALTNLGLLSVVQGSPSEARASLERAIGILRALSDRRSLSYALGLLGDALLLESEREFAELALNEALMLSEELNLKQFKAEQLFIHAMLLIAGGDVDGACRSAAESKSIAETTGETVLLEKLEVVDLVTSWLKGSPDSFAKLNALSGERRKLADRLLAGKNCYDPPR